MAKAKKEITWFELNTQDLPASVQKLHKLFADAQTKAAEARKPLDAAILDQIAKDKLVPDGQEAVVGHKWGKISVGFTEASGSTKGGKITLGKGKA